MSTFYSMLRGLSVVALLLMLPGLASAAIFVEHATPPVIEKGKTTRVTFHGSRLAHAQEVWFSLPAGSVKAKVVESHADRAVFDLEATATVPVGICGLRVATVNGLSNALLFHVDDLPVKGRDASEAMKVTLPTAIWGTFQEAVADEYRIEVKPGQKVSFEVIGSRFGKDADPLITIRDAKNKWITERDNDPGLYYDSRFEHTFAQAGTYTIEVRDSRFRGADSHHYVLRMGRFPAGRVTLPSVVRSGRNTLQMPEIPGSLLQYEGVNSLPGNFFGNLKAPDDDGSTWVPLTLTEREITLARSRDPEREKAQILSTALPTTLAFNFSPLRANPFLPLDALLLQGRTQATPTAVPGVLCGVLSRQGERQAFALDLAKGQQIFVRGEAKGLNSPVDLELVLTDRFGREQRRGSESRDEVTFEFTAGNPGIYGLFVRDQVRDGGNAFAYRVTVSDKPFPPTITAEVEGLTIPQGSYQPIPLLVTRTGTTGPIRLKLLNAPPGLKLTPEEIGEKENSIICKLEAETSTQLGLASVQILAESSAGVSVVRTQPLIDKQLINVDLIPHALRDDQKRLPPSVADRFAVQITPPSPFTMEIPESLITLPRYQQAGIPLVTTRSSGFAGGITFTAKGGQIADKSEGRTRVYAEFPEATAKQLQVTGSVHSKILTNLAKARIEVTGTATHQGREIHLTRCFDLSVTTAFNITSEAAKVSLLPGETAKIRLLANRLKTFDGEVILKLSPMEGINYPETVVIPKGMPSVEIEISTTATANPRKQNLQLHATATVSGYEEEQRSNPVEIEIRKVEEPKKK